MARKSWEGARDIMNKLLEPYNGDITRADPEVVRRLGQVQLGQGNYAGALNAFAVLLENQRVSGDQKSEVIKGFIDAAADKSVAPRTREHDIAVDIYKTSLSHIENDPIYLARLGWVLQRVGEFDDSKIVLEKAIQKEHGAANANMRNQLAYILINTGHMEEAARVLAESNHFHSKEILAGLYMQRGDVPNLQAAEQELRQMLRDYPVGYKNPDGTTVEAKDYKRVEMMLGSTLTSLAIKRGGAGTDTFAQAIAHYQALDRKYPNDGEIMAGLGFAYLWSAGRAANQGDKDEAYTQALKQFTKIISAKSWTPGTEGLGTRGKIEDGFIDAAASAPILTAEQTVVARELASRRTNSPTPTPASAARLAWVLIKTNDADARKEGIALLKRAAAANPTKEEDRRELADVFAAAGDFKAAAELLEPLSKSPAEAFKLAKLYAGAREWDSAKRELTKVVNDPNASDEEKRKARREVAKVTAWAGNHAEAITLIDQLVKEDPDDLEMKIFQADVNVWMKNLDRALELYLDLVKRHPDNEQIMTGFANAAAKSTGPLSAEAEAIFQKIVVKASAPENKDPLLIARVAEVYANKLGDRVKAQQTRSQGRWTRSQGSDRSP